MVKPENYSVQALNLLEGLIDEYKDYLKNIRKDTYYFKEIKKLRFKINNRYRQITDLAEIKNEINDNFFKIVVFNSDYLDLIIDELENLNLNINIEGQFLIIKKPTLTFNQIMTIVDEIEKHKSKFLSKCTKAKLDPILRAKNALENEFIDQVISKQISMNCQKIFEQKEKIINDITNKKIEKLLGKEFYNKFVIEHLNLS